MVDDRFIPDRERWPIEMDWPAHVWSVDLDRLGHLGYDSDGNLYWDGEPVEIRRPLSFTFWQKVGAAAVTISAIVAALAAAVSAYADWEALTQDQPAHHAPPAPRR